MTYDRELLKNLLTESQKGQRESYKEFLISITPYIKSIVKKRVFNQNDLDDVYQNILISIHSSLNTYDPSKDPIPWITIISQRRIIDYIRKTTRVAASEIFTDEGDVTMFMDQTNIDIEDTDILNGLGVELKRPIELTKVDGYSTKEAAEILGISESALRTRVSRALKKLRVMLSGEEK